MADENIVLKLIRQLSSPYAETRENAAMDIFKGIKNRELPITPKLFSALVNALDDDYTNVIYYAATSFGLIANKGKDITPVIPNLIRILNDNLDSEDSSADDLIRTSLLPLNAAYSHDLSPALGVLTKALIYGNPNPTLDNDVIRHLALETLVNYTEYFVAGKVETGDYDSALIEIKKVTKSVMDASKGKNTKRIKERRKILGVLSELTNSIHDKMTSDKKEFHKPVKHQSVRGTQTRKVIRSG